MREEGSVFFVMVRSSRGVLREIPAAFFFAVTQENDSTMHQEELFLNKYRAYPGLLKEKERTGNGNRNFTGGGR